MNVIDWMLLSGLIIFACLFLVYICRYYFLHSSMMECAKSCVDKMYNKLKNELAQKETNLQYRENNLNIEYDKLKETFNKKFNEVKADFDKKEKEKDKELEDALKESEEELKKSVEMIDSMIGEKIADLTLKNTLTFDCVCGKKDIPCFIDLSKENTFRCESCNSVYVVQAKFSPVIVGKASSEEEFIKIVENRLKEEENDETTL